MYSGPRGQPQGRYYVTDLGREKALEGLVFKRRWGYGTPVNGENE